MLIRKLQKSDIARVADIWLDTNLKAHDFISAKYWKDHFEFVKACCRRQRFTYMKAIEKYKALSE